MNSQNNFIFDWLDFRIARYSHGKKNSEFCTYILPLGLLFEYSGDTSFGKRYSVLAPLEPRRVSALLLVSYSRKKKKPKVPFHRLVTQTRNHILV